MPATKKKPFIPFKRKCAGFEGTKAARCQKCNSHRRRRHKVAKHLTGDTWKELIVRLRKRLHLEQAQEALLADALRICRGTRFADVASNQTALRVFLRALPLETAFDESIRFTRCERDPALPTVTGIFDHTTSVIMWKAPTNFSGKHRTYVFKFLTTCTMQGTPIRVAGPFSGRRHDFHLLSSVTGRPLLAHVKNDLLLADAGYIGVKSHTLVPYKKPQRQDMPEGNDRCNKIIGRWRSRIEHFFATLKNRWALFGGVCRIKEMELVGQLFKLAALAEHIIAHESNREIPRYATCKQVISHNKTPKLAPGDACDCCFV